MGVCDGVIRIRSHEEMSLEHTNEARKEKSQSGNAHNFGIFPSFASRYLLVLRFPGYKSDFSAFVHANDAVRTYIQRREVLAVYEGSHIERFLQCSHPDSCWRVEALMLWSRL